MEQDALKGDELQQQAEFFVSDLLETMEEAGKQRTNALGVPRGEVSQLDEDGKYAKWGHNEAPWKESDIEIDPETGWRFQMWNVGMTRNAKAENRKIEKVFLDPIRHVVKDQNVPLRGWYQSKFNESPLARPRPCFSEALLCSQYLGTCPVKCSFCFSGDTLVNTPNGDFPISSLKIGDEVWSYKEGYYLTRCKVENVSVRKVDSYYEVVTKGAKFKVTGEHPFFLHEKGFTPVCELKVGDYVHSGKPSNRDMTTGSRQQSYYNVLSIKETFESLEVYDIQTEVGNFYAEWHLVKNCYINHGVRGYRGSGITTVDPEYPNKIRRQVSRMLTAAPFYMSSFLEPFNELEPHYQNTRKTAKVALDNKLPMFFLTRKTAPDWVYDYLKQNEYSYMQFSINTSNHDDWMRLSPMANTLQQQIDQVRAFHEAGIYVSIQVNPICAGVTSNEDIVKLIHMLAEAGADHLIFKFVEIGTYSRKGMIQGMRERFHDADAGGGNTRVDLFDYLFSEIIGGFYTIKEDYRKAALDLFADECKRAGVTMATCYEYEYGRDKAGNITNKTGTSMGKKYLTADQCHGHRVPMFTRDSTDDPWKEIKGCPPSGCLTCQDDAGKQETPCHNPILASAPALTPGDLLGPALLPPGSQHGVFKRSLKMVR